MCPASEMIVAGSFSPLDFASQNMVHGPVASATPGHLLKMQTFIPILDLLKVKLHFQQVASLFLKADHILESPREV